ncbi:MAG: HAD family phosphatase [Chloroflexi bacterium]|nr:HAD family phosphatase [Chloroflexota bacterium]
MRVLASRPHAVIFDMDGLMLDTENMYRRAWQQAAAELGYALSDAQFLTFVGHRLEECQTLLVQLYGAAFPLAEFLDRSSRIHRERLAVQGAPVKPGLHALLDTVSTAGLKTAVATSSGRKNMLRCLGPLTTRMDVIVTGDDVAQSKPAPDIYLLAVQRLGLAPQQCLALEDSDVGVQAAHAAGVPVVIVPDLKPPAARSIACAVCVCQSLADVRLLIEV